jgi:hypothetical protein
LPSTEQDFGCAVPKCDDFVGVGSEGNAKGSCEAEVADFEIAVAVDEEILRFEVAVENTV